MGETLWLPSTANVAVMPEMLTDVALVVVQLSVVDPPEAIAVEEAVKESITGSAGFTVTVTMSTAVLVTPPSPVAVSL